MEQSISAPKLKLNKKVVSKLNARYKGRQPQNGYTDTCTFPECASEPLCKTDQLASCAPCAPPSTKDPNPVSRNC